MDRLDGIAAFSLVVETGSFTAAAERLQKACHTGYFRPYTNPDVTGCELGGAVKNVIALAVGISVGMGLGDNTRAMLITRGLAETARLGAALGADQHTFAGLAGLAGQTGLSLAALVAGLLAWIAVPLGGAVALFTRRPV